MATVMTFVVRMSLRRCFPGTRGCAMQASNSSRKELHRRLRGSPREEIEPRELREDVARP